MFCGDSCRATALASFHKLECQSMSSILQLDMGKMSLLAVRILSIAGLDFLSTSLPSLFTVDEPSTEEENRTLAYDANGQYNSLGFAPIFHLISNSGLRSVSDLFKRSLMAACLTRCLKLDNHPDVTLFGSLLLKLLQNLPCNAHEVSETSGLDKVSSLFSSLLI
jgi:SET and MYND domain-containing protein 4